MDSPLKVKGALRRLHLGPGDHPSGSPQSVHAGDGASVPGGASRSMMTNYDEVGSSVRSIKMTWLGGEARSIALTAMQGDIIHEDATQELYVWERGHVIGVLNISAQAATFTIEQLESLDAPDLEGDKLTQVYFLASNERGMGTTMMQYAVDVAAKRGHGIWVASESGAFGFYKHIGMKQPILRPPPLREGIPAPRDEKNLFFYFTAEDARRLASDMTVRTLPDSAVEHEPEDGAFARSDTKIVKRHLGPGDHPSGSPQSVHAGDGAIGGSANPRDVVAKEFAGVLRRIPKQWRKGITLNYSPEAERSIHRPDSLEITIAERDVFGLLSGLDLNNQRVALSGHELGSDLVFDTPEEMTSHLAEQFIAHEVGHVLRDRMAEEQKARLGKLARRFGHRVESSVINQYTAYLEDTSGSFLAQVRERRLVNETSTEFIRLYLIDSERFAKLPKIVRKEIEKIFSVPPIVQRGGPGSGNFGHAGRPGKVGGSAPNGESGINLPLARKIVDGRTVTENIPNIGSISATFTNWDELQGIREVKFSDFGTGTDKPKFATARQRKAAESLAKLIKDNGWIDPLIVVYDRESAELGPYVLEGATRFDALQLLEAVSFPALVVIDRDPQTGILQRAVNRFMTALERLFE